MTWGTWVEDKSRGFFWLAPVGRCSNYIIVWEKSL